MAKHEDILRHLTLGDSAYLERVFADRSTIAPLDSAAAALVKLAALVVTDGSDVTWYRTVGEALDAGVTRDEVVDALVVLAPVIGFTRVAAVAPKVAGAIGYDVSAAIETFA